MNNTNLAYAYESEERRRNDWEVSWTGGYREELIGGKVFSMSPASCNHAIIAGNIFNIFSNFLKGKPCLAFADNCMLHLTKEDHFIPDMMVVCDRSKIKKNWVEGAPDLVVEVLSPSTAKNDLFHKRKVYSQCGVREYWIVSPHELTIQQYLPEDGELHLADVYAGYTPEDWEIMNERERASMRPSFRCSLFNDLEIRLEDVFANVL